MPNELANKILAILEPYIGKLVAKAGLSAQCAKLGKTMDNIDEGDLRELAERVGGAMNTFGKDGNAISREIRSL